VSDADAEQGAKEDSQSNPAATPAATAAPTPAEVKARLEARKRLGQTAIGIAPPALGSKGPPTLESAPSPSPSAAKKFNEEPPTKPQTLAFGAEPPTKPENNPLGAVAGGDEPAAAAAAAAAVPSKPPPVPSKPPPPLPSSTNAKSTPISPLLDHPLAATQKSEGFAAGGGGQSSSPSKPPPPPIVIGGKKQAKPGSQTLIGTAPPAFLANPAPIVPRRRTPSKGIPAAAPVSPPTESTPTVTVEGVESIPISPSQLTPIASNAAAIPKVTPAAGAPPDLKLPDPVVVTEKAKPSIPAPIIRIPQGGMLGSSAALRTDAQGTLICEILVKNGAVTQEDVDKALSLQEERGGQIGRILVSIGACTEEAIAKALIEQLRLRKDGGYFMSDISAAARERKDVVGLKVLTRPTRTVAVLLLTDIFSLLLAALIATSVHWFRTYSELQALDFTAWLVVGPSVALCMLTFLGVELYSPMAKSTPDEIRDITFAASLVHLGASVLSTLGDLPIVKWGVFVRGVWWAATLFLVPVIRSLVRNYFSVQPWWGIPVCVLGAAKTGRLVVRTLKAQPRSGLKPVMMLDDDITKHGTLRASFTNEKMDVYSVNVSAAHFLTAEQRAELASDIFGDDRSSSIDSEAERASQPISSDHIPIAPEAWQTKIELREDPAPLAVLTAAAVAAGGGVPTEKKIPTGPIPPDRQSSDEFFNPDSQRISRSGITKDASQFPRGKFAEVDGVPLVGDLSLAPVLATRLNIPYGVIAMPGVDSAKLLHIVERIGGRFTHMLIIPDLFGFATMGVPAKSLGGILGVEVRQQLLLPGPRLAKRCIDVALTGFGTLFVLPFLLLIALLIKIDSK